MGNRQFKKQYNKGTLIGTGTYGNVYHCERLSDHKEFAVKIIVLDNVSEIQRKKLTQDILLMKSLAYEHIVCFIDLIEESEKFFLVMELANSGGNLEFIIRQKKKTD